MTISKSFKVGQIAIDICNPFGLDGTLTLSVVYALDCEILGYGGVAINGTIQADESIKPDNSRGPLHDINHGFTGL